MRVICLAVLLVCVALPRADTIDDYVARQMQTLRLPGLAVAVVRDGRVETLRTYGKAISNSTRRSRATPSSNWVP